MSLARPRSGVTVDPLNENGCFGRDESGVIVDPLNENECFGKDGSAMGGSRGMG